MRWGRLRTATAGWRSRKYGPAIDPWSDEATRTDESMLVPPLAPPPNVARIDCGREPARPSLSSIRARKRAA